MHTAVAPAPIHLAKAPFRPGERWGPYVLDERIASGGMAEVFRARRLGAAAFSRQVCLKRLHAHLTRDPKFRDLFLDEALLGAKLRHRNIVSIDDLGEHAGRFFFAMEFVRGVDLAALRVAATNPCAPFPADAAIHIAAEVLEALHAAHTATDPESRAPLHVVHRDVTPHNVLVAFNGQIKLTDFGVARAHGGRRATEGRLVCGKPGYMPLEQALGRGVGPNADLFALGVTLFELLTGRKPFCVPLRKPTLGDYVAAQMRDDRLSLGAFRPDLPEAFIRAVDAMLVPRPDLRIATAAEALAAIEALPARHAGGRVLGALLTRLYPGEASLLGIELSATTRVDDPLGDQATCALAPRVIDVATDRRSSTPAISSLRRRAALALGAASAVCAGLIPGSLLSSALPPVARLAPIPIPTMLATRAIAAPAPAPPAPTVRELEPAPEVEPCEHATAARHEPVRVRHVPRTRDEASAAIRVIALPWGDVRVDGRDAGRAPVVVPVDVGEHAVRVVGPSVSEEHVRVAPGETRVLVFGAD